MAGLRQSPLAAFKKSLTLKLLTVLVGLLTVLVGVIAYTSVSTCRSRLLATVLLNAEQTADVLKRSLRYAMLKNERETIYHIIHTVAKEPGIKKVRIYNKEGQIVFSSLEHEAGSFVDLRADACIGCHGQARTLERLPRTDRFREYRLAKKGHVLGLILPIENEPECANQGCHASPKAKPILGVLDVILSLTSVDESVKALQAQLLIQLLVLLLAVTLVSVVLLVRFVRNPLRVLLEGTEQVRAGNLAFVLKAASEDEIGDLCRSFNEMARSLMEARDKILSWNEELEKRVEERTAQLKKAHEEIIRAAKMASVGKLAAIVAHEINNPLFGVRTYAKLLQRRLEKEGVLKNGPEGDTAKILATIEAEVARCGEIVKNLLQFSRPSAPKIELKSLNAAVEKAIRLIQHQIDLLGAEMIVGLDKSLPDIPIDEQKIQQALLALLINACEAIPNGSGRIEVRTGRSEAGDGVEVFVKDNGAGIDEDVLPYIFEPFFTTKGQKPGSGGTGLGLSVVQSIVTLHHGRIAASSKKGEGTTFVMLLPFKQPEHDEEFGLEEVI